jgi:hypothetical protein
MLTTLPVQVDGEPWVWPASTISVTWHNQAQLLFNSKRDKTGKKQKTLLEGKGGSKSDSLKESAGKEREGTDKGGSSK